MIQQKKTLFDNEMSPLTESTNPKKENSSSVDISLITNYNDKNKIAEHILFRLKQKLQGFENGTQLSCKGQVNLLIQEAMNPENLARLYAGWQPYL